MQTSSINGLQLQIPAVLEGVLPVSPCTVDFPYEIHSWLALEALVSDSSVVYDCGAAHGIVSALLVSRWPAGVQVHAFEANPAMYAIASQLLPSAGRVTWNQLCVGERSGGEVEFHCVPGRQAVASSRHSVVRTVHERSQTTPVSLVSLDDYARRSGAWPDVLKVDIEGSEYAALLGAREIVARSHPDWVIETHPRQMVGEGASLGALCTLLEQEHGYSLFDLLGGEMLTAQVFTERYRAAPGYLLASLRLRDAAFVDQLQALHRKWVSRYAGPPAPIDPETLAQARDLVAARRFEEGLAILEPLLLQASGEAATAEVSYLLAYSLQESGRGEDRVEALYAQALANGFAPFWVHYNLGAWLVGQRRREEARRHLSQAATIDGSHEGVQYYLRNLG